MNSAPSLDRDGACRLAAAVGEPALRRLEGMLPTVAHGGVRLAGSAALAEWIDAHLAGLVPVERPVPNFHAVRAVLFDKRPGANWALGWHQDRTIAVKARLSVEGHGYGAWSVKQGLLHVEPPFSVTRQMRTLRLHLDPVDDGNAPLRVALGSHRLGFVADTDAQICAERLPILSCFADRGDVWAYATPILHCSAPATNGALGRRRVLQIDFSASNPPGGLEWLAIAGASLSESAPSTKSAA